LIGERGKKWVEKREGKNQKDTMKIGRQVPVYGEKSGDRILEAESSIYRTHWEKPERQIIK